MGLEKGKYFYTELSDSAVASPFPPSSPSAAAEARPASPLKAKLLTNHLTRTFTRVERFFLF